MRRRRLIRLGTATGLALATGCNPDYHFGFDMDGFNKACISGRPLLLDREVLGTRRCGSRSWFLNRARAE